MNQNNWNSNWKKIIGIQKHTGKVRKRNFLSDLQYHTQTIFQRNSYRICGSKENLESLCVDHTHSVPRPLVLDVRQQWPLTFDNCLIRYLARIDDQTGPRNSTYPSIFSDLPSVLHSIPLEFFAIPKILWPVQSNFLHQVIMPVLLL